MTDHERNAYESNYWRLIGSMTLLDQMIEECYPSPELAVNPALTAEVRALWLQVDALTAVWVNQVGDGLSAHESAL